MKVKGAFLRECGQRACKSMKTLRRIFGGQSTRDGFRADGCEWDADRAARCCCGVCVDHGSLSHGRKAMRVWGSGWRWSTLTAAAVHAVNGRERKRCRFFLNASGREAEKAGVAPSGSKMPVEHSQADDRDEGDQCEDGSRECL
jgi:hypothetical protein